MSWFLLAVIGHLANGVAFIIDKILLRTAYVRSATYAGSIGILSTAVVFAIPFVHAWPRGSDWILAILSGATFVLALWAFFAALARAEASRIVPIVGSVIPILTLAGSFTFLGERLTDKTFLGFGLLILATMLLSRGGKGRPTPTAVWLAVTSAFLFAFSSVTAKATYDASGFLGGFIVSRLAAAAMSLLLLMALDARAGKEALRIFSSLRRASSAQKKTGRLSAMLVLVGQSLGMLGFVFVQWATAQGSASIVNALQAVQYALLVIVGLALHRRAPRLLGESATRNAILLKIIALILTGIGMYFVV